MFRNGLEPWHLIVVAIVVIVLFGSKKLPDAARGLGKSMRILKSEARAMKEESSSSKQADSTTAAATPATPTPAPVAITPSEVGTYQEPTPTSTPSAK
jgi:sec-independent protein translocase protein TatA